MSIGKYLFIGLTCLCYQQATAQDNFYLDEQRTFYGGIIAGANFSQVDGDDFRGYNKTGANLGGIVYARLDDQLAASLEILYAQKGSRSKLPQETEPGIYITKYRINLNYAEIPVLINYFIKNKHHISAGFSYSRLAGSSEILVTNPPPNPPINLQDYPFKKSDFNFIIGGQLHIYKGLFLNARFQYSLASIRDKVPTNSNNIQQFNDLLVLRLMYLFL